MQVRGEGGALPWGGGLDFLLWTGTDRTWGSQVITPPLVPDLCLFINRQIKTSVFTSRTNETCIGLNKLNQNRFIIYRQVSYCDAPAATTDLSPAFTHISFLYSVHFQFHFAQTYEIRWMWKNTSFLVYGVVYLMRVFLYFCFGSFKMIHTELSCFICISS